MKRELKCEEAIPFWRILCCETICFSARLSSVCYPGALGGSYFYPIICRAVFGCPCRKSRLLDDTACVGFRNRRLAWRSAYRQKGPVKTVILSGIISCAGFALFPLWVTEKWEFVIASVVAGIGFGFLLGAPLNVLVSEAAKTNKGTALGTLSLVRQIGLTLAPTLYAGFITAGFDQIGDEISVPLIGQRIFRKGDADHSGDRQF